MLSVMICAIMLIAIAFSAFVLGVYYTIKLVAQDEPRAMDLIEKYREVKEND